MVGEGKVLRLAHRLVLAHFRRESGPAVTSQGCGWGNESRVHPEAAPHPLHPLCRFGTHTSLTSSAFFIVCVYD